MLQSMFGEYIMFYTKVGEKDFCVQHFIRGLVMILYFKTKILVRRENFSRKFSF